MIWAPFMHRFVILILGLVCPIALLCPLEDTGVGWLMWSDDLQISVHSSSFHVILATAVNTTSNIKFVLLLYLW
jgi:hypothetical protein